MSVSFGPTPRAPAADPARATSSTATTTTVVAAVPGKRIRVYFVHLAADGNVYVYVQFSSRTAAANRLVPTYLAVRTAYNANKIASVWEGPAGDSLQMVTDAAVNVECQVDFEYV